jgi:hypothetical protein
MSMSSSEKAEGMTGERGLIGTHSASRVVQVMVEEEEELLSTGEIDSQDPRGGSADHNLRLSLSRILALQLA